MSAHPEVRKKPVDGSLEELGPADQALRADYLEEQGDVAGAEEARRAAQERLRTPEFNTMVTGSDVRRPRGPSRATGAARCLVV